MSYTMSLSLSDNLHKRVKAVSEQIGESQQDFMRKAAQLRILAISKSGMQQNKAKTYDIDNIK